MSLKQTLKADKLKVEVFETRKELGCAAASDVAGAIEQVIADKGECNMIFAAAPSQNEFLNELISNEHIDFSKINAFHMDEYIGLANDAPQGFGNFLRSKLFDNAAFKAVYYMNGNAEDMQIECERYAQLLKKYPIDIVCMGIGENGHIAFNDPHVACFNDEHLVKIVDLDEKCRQQQVNDGCFENIYDVPTHAVTLTIPALVNVKNIFCMVPGKNKANAVYGTINSEINETIPSTILRKHENAVLYIDRESGALVC